MVLQGMQKLRYLVYNEDMEFVQEIIDKCRHESRNMELLIFQGIKSKYSQEYEYEW